MNTFNPTPASVHRCERLARWISIHYNGVQSAFVKKFSLNQGEISQFMLQKRTLGERRARKLEQQTDLPTGYLDEKGDDDAHHGESVNMHHIEDDIPAGYTAIKEYDVEFSCGSSADGDVTFEEQIGGSIAIYKEEWFTQKGARREAVMRFKATGKSMFPIIRPNWRVAVDTDRKQIPVYPREQAEHLRAECELPIYGVVDDGVRKFKYTYIEEETGELILESHNPDFKTERRDMEYVHNYLYVIGLVIDISGDPNGR